MQLPTPTNTILPNPNTVKRLLEQVTSQTVTLNQVYDGDWPEENELIWDFVGPVDMDTPFPVITINPVEIFKNFKPDGVTPMWEVYKDSATRAQKKLVTSFRKQAQKIAKSDYIVVSGDELVDGFHRVAAMALEGITAAMAVDLVDEEEEAPPLDEQNTLGSGAVVGYTGPLGADTKPGHEQLWDNGDGKGKKDVKLGSDEFAHKALEGLWEDLVEESFGAMHEPDFEGEAMPGLWAKTGEKPSKAVKSDSPDVHDPDALALTEAPIVEPKRKNPTDVGSLGIKKLGGVDNIMAVFSEATPEEKEYWGKWYHNAKQEVVDLAQEYSLAFPVTAAVVAVLSPGNKWRVNMLAAQRLLANAKSPTGPQQKIPGYPRQVARALDILKTGDVGKVTGPKVTVFFKSLVDPASVEHDLVLDGHAINIWRGEKVNLNSLASVSKVERAKMLADYKTAAELLKVPVQAVQAVTWYIWKYTNDAPVVKHKVFDTSSFLGKPPSNDNNMATRPQFAAIEEDLMSDMGYEHVGNSKARIASDTYVQKDDSRKGRSKKIIRAVNKNIDKTKGDTFHDPSMLGNVSDTLR